MHSVYFVQFDAPESFMYNMRKSDAFDAKIVNTRLTQIFKAIFAPDERLPSSATLYS